MLHGGRQLQTPTSSELVHVKAGDTVVVEGERGDDVYFLTSGSFEVTCEEKGRDVFLARLGPGDVVGELVAAVGGVRTATVRALTDGTVNRCDRGEYQSWLEANPDEQLELARQARHRLDEIHMTRFLSPLVSPVHDDVITEIVEAVEWTYLTAGETLFAQGDPSDAAYFVVSGRLRVVAANEDGNTRFDNELGRGDVVGELGLIDVSARSATVFAMRDATLARLSLDTFQRLTVSHPAVMLRIFRHLLIRLTQPSVRSERVRSLAIAVTAPLDRRVFTSEIVAEIDKHGTTKQVRAAVVDAELLRDGAAQCGMAGPVSSSVGNLLHEYELNADCVVYETDKLISGQPLSPWSERAIRQADRLVVVCSADPDADETGVLTRVFESASEVGHLNVWAAIQHPAGVEAPDTAGHPAAGKVHEIHHLRNKNRSDLHRLARLSSGNGIGLVLSGGGARGYAHIGVIQALQELGVPIDRVGGASIGSVIAAGQAADFSTEFMTHQLAKGMSDPVDYTIPLVALAKGERIRKLAEHFYGDRRIEDMWTPFYCVSTNLTQSRVEVHRTGSIGQSIRASVAIPGVFPPVPFGEDLLVDGGVLNNLPVDIMAADPSISTVIAVEVTPPTGPRARADYGLSVSGWSALRSKLGRGKSDYPAISAVLMRSLLVGSTSSRDRHFEDGLVDLLIDLDLRGVGILDFSTIEPVVQRGYEGAKPIIEAWLNEHA